MQFNNPDAISKDIKSICAVQEEQEAQIEKARVTIDAGVQTDAVQKEIGESHALSMSRGSQRGSKAVPAGDLVKSSSSRSRAQT